MMSGLMGLFGARRDPKQSARDAIVGLRQHLQMIEKKEEFLQKKIEEELKKAKANAVSNKPGARSAHSASDPMLIARSGDRCAQAQTDGAIRA